MKMKKKLLWLLCMFMLSLPLFAQMSKAEMQNMYLTYLRNQNIEATVDSDGDIVFQYELPSYNPLPFYIIVDETDQMFFQILTGFGLYSLETAQERGQAYIAAIYATGAASTVKVFVDGSGTNVRASGQVFLASPGNFEFVFHKMMLQFELALNVFFNNMR
jgi:hypothetical protein